MKHKNTSWLLVAALAILGAQASWAADVVSSNIVGYNKVTLTSGYNMLGANWKLVGGQSPAMAQVMDASDLPAMDLDSLSFNAQLLCWDGAGYAFYGWSGEVGDEDLDNQWLDDQYEIADIPAANGTGFWIDTSESATVIFSGEVPAEDAVTVNVSAGYNLIANPFPETISIQKITSTDLPAMDLDSLAFNAQLLTWNGSGYSFYGWAGEVGDEALDNKWLDDQYEEATATLDIGKGCWIQTSAPGTVTFTK